MSKIEVNTVDAQCGSTITVGSSGKNVKIEGNDIRSNDYKASDGGNIINQSGTSITLGASGDTINLASGASQSGFGRTGTVDWQTAIKTATFTAVNGEGYFCNTTGGAFQVNLPASPSVGNIVSIKDYARTFASNNLTVGRNGSNLDGVAVDQAFDQDGLSLTLIYMDASRGWTLINDDATSGMGATFICASVSGCSTLTTCGNFKIARFTGPGTFTVNSVGNASGSNTVETMIVAGGGGGGRGSIHGAGAGAGGYRTSAATPVSAQAYPVVVGGGGAGAPAPGVGYGSKGSDSSAISITSTGGGQGGGWNAQPGLPGGSGSGSASSPSPTNFGAGNDPPVSPPQGFPGGASCGSRMGGGGGAGEAGNTDGQGHGGDGVANSITGSVVTYAGGGSGGGSAPSGDIPGGDGGGGVGGGPPGTAGGAGTVNTGGGGGGAYSTQAGGTGGSGIVVIKYKFQ
jgi:hypothetical protein